MLHIEHVLMVLCEAEVAFIVIGGMAAVAQGSAYVTADLDICYQRHPQNYNGSARRCGPCILVCAALQLTSPLCSMRRHSGLA
jgi:hypothetical protein